MKSKKAFMLGAAMAASCFVSAFALAEQTPQKLSAEAVKQAVDKALKSGGKLDAAKVPASLKQKLRRPRPVSPRPLPRRSNPRRSTAWSAS